MKIRLLYFLFSTTFVAVLLLSNSGGAGVAQQTDRTGSPISPGTCSDCHGGGNFNPTIAAQLLRNGQAVSQYEPGEDYTLRLTITAANGTPSGYGFQTVALRGENNANAGAWDSPPAGFRLTTINNRQYVEQNSTRNSNVLEIRWKAPAAGSGPVRFYASGNAVNRNGSTGGDASTSLTAPLLIAERIVSSVFDNQLLSAEVKIYPNPVSAQLNLTIQVEKAGQYFLSLRDLQGREMMRRAVQLRAGDNTETLLVNDLAVGHYLVQLSDGTRATAVKMIKR